MKLIIPKFWLRKSYFSILLFPFSLVYLMITSLYRKKCIYAPRAKVITIGNITLGGAGKTPVALSIAKLLNKHKLIILTRGYKGEICNPTIVNSSHNIFDVGDEALLLAKYFPTCVSKDRLQGIKFLENLGYEVIITDDGLQDGRFSKSMSILVIDKSFGFGNGLIFPAGPLREKIETGIKKADLIAIIGSGDYVPPDNKQSIYGTLVKKNKLNNNQYIAFAGIGNPNKFFKTIVESGGIVIKEFAFGDHHQYTDDEIEQLLEVAKHSQATLITTEKDYMRINIKYRNVIEVMEVELIWNNEKILQDKLLAL